MKVRIVGTGMAVPERVLTNHDFEQLVDTTDEWITSRTGIKERRVAEPGEALSDFAVPAAQRALEMAGIPGAAVDLVVCCTVCPDMPFPATATLIQSSIGAANAAAFDLSAACTGFLYGLGIAERYLAGGAARCAVVVGGEVLTKYVDWNDRNTCVLFGDGAGAVALTADGAGGEGGPERGILDVSLRSDGTLGDLIYRPGGGSRHPPSVAAYGAGLEYIKMRGNETFKVAVRSLAEVSQESLDRSGVALEEVRWFVPHQANLRIITAVGERLGLPPERTYVNIERYGNTSAASIPIALDELNRSGQIEPGNVVLLSAFGAGLTWGAGVVRW